MLMYKPTTNTVYRTAIKDRHVVIMIDVIHCYYLIFILLDKIFMFIISIMYNLLCIIHSFMAMNEYIKYSR